MTPGDERTLLLFMLCYAILCLVLLESYVVNDVAPAIGCPTSKPQLSCTWLRESLLKIKVAIVHLAVIQDFEPCSMSKVQYVLMLCNNGPLNPHNAGEKVRHPRCTCTELSLIWQEVYAFQWYAMPRVSKEKFGLPM